MINSFSEVIDKLGGPAAFGRAVGMTPNTAKQARRRDSLSPEYFSDAANAARERGIAGVTVERLVQLAAERRKAGRAA
jgi:hypothetical protein